MGKGAKKQTGKRQTYDGCTPPQILVGFLCTQNHHEWAINEYIKIISWDGIPHTLFIDIHG